MNVQRINQTIGLNIKMHRFKKEWSEEFMAKTLSVCVESLIKMERGQYSFTLEHLVEIARRLETTCVALIMPP